MHAPLIKQGWLRVLLFLVLLIALIIGVPMIFAGVISSFSNPLHQFAASYTFTAIFFVLATWLFKRLIDGEPFSFVGLSWKGYERDGGIGLFTALAILCTGTLILLLTGQIIFTGTNLDVNGMLLMLLMMVIVAFMEEIVFRGYVLYNLMKSLNKWIALLLSAIAFAAIHAGNPNVSVLPIINVFLAGILLGINYIFSRNLWFAIMFHLGWNFTQGAIMGYEVSGMDTPHFLQQYLTGSELWTGGSFGFEGSLLCTLLLIVSICIWAYLFAQKYKMVKEQA